MVISFVVQQNRFIMNTFNHRLIYSILFMLSLSLIYAQSKNSAKAFTKAADNFYGSTLEALGTVPGLSIVVVKGNQTVYSKGFGSADLEKNIKATDKTNFYIASCTKAFTGLLAGLYHQEGTIDLDASLSHYFPNTKFSEGINADKIKIRDLITHTSGINNGPISSRLAYTGDHNHQLLMDLVAASELNEAGYGNFSYTNSGYNIYGLIIQEVVGKPWQDCLEERIFQPLKMDRTTAYISKAEKNNWPMAVPYVGWTPDQIESVYLRKKDNTMQSAGGLITTAEDMATWLKVQIQQGKLGKKQIFPLDVITQAQSPIANGSLRSPVFDGQSYGYGWSIGQYKEQKVLWHGGGFPGALTLMTFLPEAEIGVAVMVNDGLAGNRLNSLFTNFALDWWLEEDGVEEKYQKRATEFVEEVRKVGQRVLQGKAERANREWQLSYGFPHYSGEYHNELYGTIRIEGSEDQIKVHFGNLYCVGTPYTKPNTVRIELVPGSGEVLEFMLEGEKVTGIRYDGDLFKKE